MTTRTTEQIKATTARATTGIEATNSSLTELAKAYQDLGAKSAERLTSSIKALAATKSPQEFFELQQKLVNVAVTEAVKDGTEIANLTSALFTAAFKPIASHIETLSTHPKS